MESLQDDDCITLRYIGYVSGEGRSASTRHEEDSLRSGPMRSLRDSHLELYNEPLEPQLEDFVDASNIKSPCKDIQLLIDARETCLIALFGSGSPA